MSDDILVRNPWSGQIDSRLSEPAEEWLESECARLRSGHCVWREQ